MSVLCFGEKIILPPNIYTVINLPLFVKNVKNLLMFNRKIDKKEQIDKLNFSSI